MEIWMGTEIQCQKYVRVHIEMESNELILVSVC